MTAYASSTALLPGQIAYEAGAEVRDALASLGRTEDVRFSPEGDRLAVACYARNEIYELTRLRDLARSKADTAEVRAVLGAVQSTKAWRLTAPLRRLSGVLRRPARG